MTRGTSRFQGNDQRRKMERAAPCEISRGSGAGAILTTGTFGSRATPAFAFVDQRRLVAFGLAPLLALVDDGFDELECAAVDDHEIIPLGDALAVGRVVRLVGQMRRRLSGLKSLSNTLTSDFLSFPPEDRIRHRSADRPRPSQDSCSRIPTWQCRSGRQKTGLSPSSPTRVATDIGASILHRAQRA
jgi:hypothetical protein